jgi:PIN domain nuclease of toxin-antitoxin system
MNCHLDTHVVVWLYLGLTDKLPAPVQRMLLAGRPLISPAVQAELTGLHERGWLRVPAAEVLNDLRERADLGVAESSFARVCARYAELPWASDPFDRLIAAHALCDDAPLLTRDPWMLQHCGVAVWDV